MVVKGLYESAFYRYSKRMRKIKMYANEIGTRAISWIL